MFYDLIVWLFSIDDKMHAWWKEADFGFVKKVQDDLVTVCEPRNEVEPCSQMVSDPLFRLV